MRRTMGDREANEGQADESTCLIKIEEDVDEMKSQTVTTADSPDGSVTGTKGADPNTKNQITRMPLIHATAKSGNLDLLEKLLNEKTTDVNVKDNEGRTILHWWAWVSVKNPDDKEKLENCFKLIRQNGFDNNRSFKDKDSSGRTPFSIALTHEYWDRIALMLNTDIDLTAPAYIGQTLESANKSSLNSILDYCFESNDKPVNSEDLQVTLKLNSLVNMVDYVLASPHKDILKHPILSLFFTLIWEEYKLIFFSNVILYVAFLFYLTAYILFSEFCNTQMNRGVANITNDLLSFNNSNVTCGMDDEKQYRTLQFLWYALMILLGLVFLREVCQLYLGRMNYKKAKENWLVLLLIIVTFTSCSGIVDSNVVKRHLFAFVLLLGWFELALILGRLPQFSVQTEMLKTVCWTFSKIMAGYFVLILAFAFSFHVLFKEDKLGDYNTPFTNPFISILTTIVMFAGAFDASDLPFDTLPITSHLIHLLFVLFAAIVLLNLMNELAVGDTRQVRENAKTHSSVARAKLISNILNVCFALRSFNICYIEIPPAVFLNKQRFIGSTDLRSLQRIITKRRELNKKQKETENVESWKLFSEKLSTLQQMLENIMTHFNIPEP